MSKVFFAVLYFVVTNTKSNCLYSDDGLKAVTEGILEDLVENKSVLAALLGNASVVNGMEIDLGESARNADDRGKVCLRNVTACMAKDDEYKQSTNKLSKLLFSSLPLFDMSNVKEVSKICQKQSKIYIRDLRKFKLWALKMYDSTAKIPSGLLNGNVNQLGDYDLCLSAFNGKENINGKYCLPSIEIQRPYSPYLAALHRLMQSHYHFRSKLEDPGHRVPRFSSINWALCVPDGCSPKDVKFGLATWLSKLINGTEIELKYEMNAEMCKTKLKNTAPLSTVIGISVFCIVILLELFATIYDNYNEGNDKSRWITAFSFKKNLKCLITIKRSPGDIEAVHGIRMLNAVLLLLAHKSMALFFMPFANRTEYVEYVGRPFTVLGRAASLYTDPFIMISGTLTAYSIIGKLDKTGKINIFQEYMSRLFRIVPAFAALIAFCTFVLPWLNDGPMWNLVVTHHSHICKKYWWRNLLFIHNYFGFKDMCLTHTHHIGIDTQLFFLSPLLIYVLWKWPKLGSFGLIGLATLSTLARYYVTYTMKLSNYIHFGTSVQQLFATADNMYILPAHRLTVYIMGIFLGYIVKKYKNKTLSKSQLRIGNALAMFSFLISYLGPAFMGSIDYVYNPIDAAWYAAFSPILWVASFGWIIFTSQLGYKGILGRFFSMPLWTLWTKISYTVYLTQFPIYFYNVGVIRSSSHFAFFSSMFNLQEYCWVIGLSVILTLVFEMPFQNIRNQIIKNRETVNNVKITIKKES